jgi:hypothetical protein
VKAENGDLLSDSHNNLNRWKNNFSQLLNVHNISDVRQIEVHTAEPLLPGSSRLEAEIAIAKLEKYKSPVSFYYDNDVRCTAWLWSPPSYHVLVPLIASSLICLNIPLRTFFLNAFKLKRKDGSTHANQTTYFTSILCISVMAHLVNLIAHKSFSKIYSVTGKSLVRFAPPK